MLPADQCLRSVGFSRFIHLRLQKHHKLILFQCPLKFPDDAPLLDRAFQKLVIIVGKAAVIIVFYRFTGKICLVAHDADRLFGILNIVYAGKYMQPEGTVVDLFLYFLHDLKKHFFAERLLLHADCEPVSLKSRAQRSFPCVRAHQLRLS